MRVLVEKCFSEASAGQQSKESQVLADRVQNRGRERGVALGAGGVLGRAVGGSSPLPFARDHGRPPGLMGLHQLTFSTLSSATVEVLLTITVTDSNAQEGSAGVQWSIVQPPTPA